MEMTQIWDKDGTVHAGTIISVPPTAIVKTKSVESDGYSSVQIGYGIAKEKKINKAEKGAWKDGKMFAKRKEFRINPDEVASFVIGTDLNASLFAEGDEG